MWLVITEIKTKHYAMPARAPASQAKLHRAQRIPGLTFLREKNQAATQARLHQTRLHSSGANMPINNLPKLTPTIIPLTPI